jgi:hypothetical protein
MPHDTPSPKPSKPRRLAALLAALLSLGPAAHAQAPAMAAASDAERAAVMLPVRALFDFISTKDAALAPRALLPEARLVAVRGKDGKQLVRSLAQADFVKAIGEAKGQLVERYWNPQVQVHGSVASVSTDYDFWRDGAFSHCGVNLLQLAKTDDGWRISAITYNSETQCAPSPLGPLGPLAKP